MYPRKIPRSIKTVRLVGVPSSFHLVSRPTLATAMAVYLPYGMVMGALVYLLVFRPLRRSPPGRRP